MPRETNLSCYQKRPQTCLWFHVLKYGYIKELKINKMSKEYSIVHVQK